MKTELKNEVSLRFKFAEVHCTLALADVHKLPANLSQTYGFAVLPNTPCNFAEFAVAE